MPSQISANSEVVSLPVISFTPILFGFPLHCRCIRVLHFEPIGRAVGTVGRSKALRHDSLETELAGVAEYDVAGLVDVLLKVQRPAPSAEKLGQLALACLERSVPHVLAAQLEKIDGWPMSGVRGICQSSLLSRITKAARRRAERHTKSCRKEKAPLHAGPRN